MQTIDFIAVAMPVLPPAASAVGQVEVLDWRIPMIVSRSRTLAWPALVIALVTATVGLPSSSQVVADEDSPPDELPMSGIFKVVITVEGKPMPTSSVARAFSKLEALRKAQARRPDSGSPLLVTLNVNETTREFTEVTDAIRIVQAIAEILDAAKAAKIQLGELGRLDTASTQSQQSQSPPSQPTEEKTQFRATTARDGDDGFGVGGGLGGQGGDGAGIGNQQLALQIAALRRGGAGTREDQIELLRQHLRRLLTTQQQSVPESSSVATKEAKLGEATLFSRVVHRDYQKATFSFEFGLRDDPTYLHANDWDLQYGNGGDHFHVTMVSDDRSRIVDLGKMDWGQLDTTPLAKLPPHPQPRREFVPTAEGHIYLVHTVDRNSDLYALFRVEAIDRRQGTCDITWRLVDAPE